MADERAALEQWRDFHRATLLRTCSGLTAQQLKQWAVPPSGLSLLRHVLGTFSPVAPALQRRP